MKLKHFFLFVILSLVLSLSGISCSGSANPGNSSQTPSSQQTPGETTETTETPETTETTETTESTEPAEPVELDNTLTAMKLAQAMECGWNLGNSLDARDGWSDTSKVYPFNQGLSSETCWGEVKTTKEIIETGIKNGYKTIRIPVTWCNHLTDTNYTIDSKWMARVKEIVNWAIDAGYYVILNEHHSVHEDMNSPLKKCEGYIVTTESALESRAFIQAIWKQICQNFNNEYDEHLIFETLNEPRDPDHDHCWNTQPATCEVCEAEVALLNDYNQLVLDTIRASGGNNATRFVMVPATGTGISEALKDGFKLPTDTATDKLIVTVHMYPLDSGGTGYGSHNFDDNTKSEISSKTRSLYLKFVSEGIPVVIGEFGAARDGIDSQGEIIDDFVITAKDRLDCFTYFAQQAGKYSMPFINWDCGGDGGMATINRKTCSVYEPDYLAAVIKAWKDANESAQTAETLIDPEEISLENVTIWDSKTSSYDKQSKLLKLGTDFKGADIWGNEKDLSAFKTIELTYKDATANFQFYVAYTDDTETDRTTLYNDKTSGTITLDSTKKLKQVCFQSQSTSVDVTLVKLVLKP